ncbi:MAG TPA: phenylacetate--CoA ligase [Deltaproteobacteria bacterium]|nr:phenylacetate--CoA ligase [Deltaproteobacteria bacterium]
MLEGRYETMPREELEVLQLERLQSTLNRAYLNVAHYRRALDKARILPEDIKTLSDIRLLPFTTRREIEQCYPYDMFAVPLREVVRIHTSSGQARKPIVTGHTANDLKAWARLMARFLICAGVTRDDVIQIAFRYGLMTGGFGFHAAAELIGASVIPADIGNTAEQVIIMRDYLTSVIACMPSYALILLDKLEELSINPKGLRLRRAILGAERLSPKVRQRFTDLGIEVFNSYGSSVVLGPGIAGECGAHEGLHLYEDFFIAEVIDPASGQVLPAGARGELVITTLAREAFPLIRYRTGDITMIMEGSCPCGRTHLRLADIFGRTDDAIKVKGVGVTPDRIREILEHEGVQTRTQLHIYREGSYEKADVLLEVGDSLFFDEMRTQKALVERLEKAIHAGTSVRMGVRIVPSAAFKGTSVVVDERD